MDENKKEKEIEQPIKEATVTEEPTAKEVAATEESTVKETTVTAKDGEIRRYEGLDSSEKGALRKEYFSSVNPRAKTLYIVCLIIMLPAAVLLCFVFYHMLSALINKTAMGWEWYLGFAIMPLCAAAMTIAIPISEGMERWLFRQKDILMDIRYKKRAAIIECRQTTQRTDYFDLDRKQKIALFKECIAKDTTIKFNFVLAVISVLVTLCLIVSVIVNIVRLGENINPLLSSVFGLVSFISVLYIIIFQLNYRQFICWLEYHKNITKDKK